MKFWFTISIGTKRIVSIKLRRWFGIYAMAAQHRETLPGVCGEN